MQHYLAYRAALDQGNLQAAEAAAAKALAASIEQYGDGGRTGVLAVNLAGVRLTLKEHAAAVEPARHALRIAEAQGMESGVDTRVARLILARAELPDGGSAALDRLQLAVRGAQGVSGIEGEAYPAAVELAVAADAASRYPLSREAWAASALFADGSPINPDYARASARVGEAVAEYRLLMSDAPQISTGSRFEQSLPPGFAQIDAMLVEAMDLIHDQAMQSQAGGELTLAQAVFGEALAWQAALHSRLESEDRPLKSEARRKKTGDVIGTTGDPRPLCNVRVVAEPTPAFPKTEQVAGGVGAVALKILVDESGEITRAQVAGSVGGQAFADSVAAVAPRWRIVNDGSSAPACRMAMEFFMLTQFLYR